MLSNDTSAVAFSMPGGERCVEARRRPIDFNHLARQTMDDRALEQEVLALFAQQAGRVRDRIAACGDADVKAMAHGLKGAARGVGAFAVAESAGDVEDAPGDRAAIKRLCGRIDEAREFIAAINR